MPNKKALRNNNRKTKKSPPEGKLITKHDKSLKQLSHLGSSKSKRKTSHTNLISNYKAELTARLTNKDILLTDFDSNGPKICISYA